jgi:carbamoyl-phosphate synthase small subunit
MFGASAAGPGHGGQDLQTELWPPGGNHTVMETTTGKCYISSQNHGYAVEEQSLTGTDLMVSFRNLNDDTVEGLVHKKLPLMSVQFHPEASPGPQDTGYLFDSFLSLI